MRLLRSEPDELSRDQVKAMIKKYDFYDNVVNPDSNGFTNQYYSKTIKGDKVVFDQATGLMWQQCGTELTSFEKAKKWIESLNQKGYAGYNDWRLPTTEEAMSLMDRIKKRGDLYINTIFNFELGQFWIWTSDQVKNSNWVWTVFYGHGQCHDIRPYNCYGFIVRAVRSIE